MAILRHCSSVFPKGKGGGLVFGQIFEARYCTTEIMNPVIFSDMERLWDIIKVGVKLGFDDA
jgi:hypothetical protein